MCYYLLLEAMPFNLPPPQEHPEYNRTQLFPQSLADCKFHEQHVFTQPAATLQFMGAAASGESLEAAGLLPHGMAQGTQAASA